MNIMHKGHLINIGPPSNRWHCEQLLKRIYARWPDQCTQDPYREQRERAQRLARYWWRDEPGNARIAELRKGVP